MQTSTPQGKQIQAVIVLITDISICIANRGMVGGFGGQNLNNAMKKEANNVNESVRYSIR